MYDVFRIGDLRMSVSNDIFMVKLALTYPVMNSNLEAMSVRSSLTRLSRRAADMMAPEFTSGL